MKPKTRSQLFACAVAWCLLQSPLAVAQVNTDVEREQAAERLEQLQQAIEQRRQSVQRRQQQLSSVEEALRDIENQVARTTASIRQTQQQLEANQSRITELEAEQAELQASLRQQAQMLADQIESAYRSGGNDFLQMLLNQRDPARIERILAYYRYFNDARMEQIAALQATEQELIEVETALTTQRDELNSTIERQQQQRANLREQQQRQQQQAAQLRTAQQNEQRELTDMLQNEQELTELLAALDDVLSQQDIELGGLERLRGQIRWPVEGSVRHAFGSRRSGQVNWKGVVLNTDAEESVRVIADGRVLFSDWLRGFGLVVVIDHGEGYMSLYGYNQSLTREVGEAVRRGDTIALTGQSGGQSRPGLYFEIRHEGNPIDPIRYIRR